MTERESDVKLDANQTSLMDTRLIYYKTTSSVNEYMT